MVRTQVIVVGAGFSGLSAAHVLMDAGVGCVLLEARDRVGGRVESQVNGLGERIDTGGQYLCDDMPNVMALARAHGKTLVPGRHDGRAAIQPAGMTGADLDELYQRVMAIRDRANAIDPADPSIAGLSVRRWTEAQPDAADAKAGFLTSIEGLWCRPTDALPLWYLISNDRRITNEVPELQYLLRETMHALAEDQARALGSRVRLGQAVRLLRHGCDDVTAVTDEGEVAADWAIVAVPPVMTRRIAFEPALPAGLAHALAAWMPGTVVKVSLRYDRAFWRDIGMSGTVFFLDPPGLYACDASRGDRAGLVVFVGGALAMEWGKPGEDGLRAAILGKLVTALGPEAGAPIDVTARDWSGDLWSGGGYSDTIADPAAYDAEDVLRRGLARVLFAPSELSPSFPGYIEGAIVAGRAAARRVQSELQRGSAATSPLAIFDEMRDVPSEQGDEMPSADDRGRG